MTHESGTEESSNLFRSSQDDASIEQRGGYSKESEGDSGSPCESGRVAEREDVDGEALREGRDVGRLTPLLEASSNRTKEAHGGCSLCARLFPRQEIRSFRFLGGATKT